VTSPGPTALARTAVAELFDDAALFPPASAPMEAALGLHVLAARSTWGFAQGRFLVPVGALGTLVTERRYLEFLSPLAIGVIVGSPADPGESSPLSDALATAERATQADHALTVELVEYRPTDQTAAGIAAAGRQVADVAADLGAVGFVEVAVAGADATDLAARVGALHGSGVGAKVRCGGLDAAIIPTPAALAQFVAACGQTDLPFKATAGLHHALSAADGDRRFGYLNLLIATVLAHRGVDLTTIAETLVFDDPVGVRATPDGLQVDGHDVTRVDLAAARSRFVAFGTCSFTEPLADLLAIPGMTTEER
jgi:hypothetical protein